MPRSGCTPVRWRCSPASRTTPTGTSVASSTRSTRWASSTTRSSSTSGATTAPAWRDDHGLVQRDDILERRRARRRAAARADRAVRRHRRARERPHRTARRGGLGMGRQHAVPVGQADGESPGRHSQPDGDRLAAPHRGGRRVALAVHALHRHRPDDPRGCRYPRAERGRRDRAGADGRHELPLHVRRRGGRRTAHRPVLRGDRSRAIYKDGWWACARLDKAPWDFSPETLARFGPGSGWDPDEDDWELYYLPDDFSQAKNLAAENPEKLAELKELFWQEAERNRALPILGRSPSSSASCRRYPTTRFTFAGDVQNIQNGSCPGSTVARTRSRPSLEVPDGGAEGVIVANADFIGGWALWVDEGGLLHHTYSFLGVEPYKQTSTKPLPTGDVSVKMLFEADEPKPGSGGDVTLWANDEQIGEGRLDKTCHCSPLLCGHGHEPRQRRRRRLRLRGQGAVRVHRNSQERRLRPEAATTHDDEKALHEHASIHAVAHGVGA